MRAESERAYQSGGDVSRWAEQAGIDIEGPIDLMDTAFLQQLTADRLLGQLKAMKGAASDYDVMKARGLASAMSQNTAANDAILKRIQRVIHPEDVGKPIDEQRIVPAMIGENRSIQLLSGNMRSLARIGGKELVEEAMNSDALNPGGAGGRVVEYSGGALEWVPNGPGGIPQPTTGETFYDPIAEEQARVQSQADIGRLRSRVTSNGFKRGGIVRAESERAYQAGGLAAATAEEEETTAPALTVDQVIERTTGSGVQPSITSMIIQNKDQAMARLRQGREDIQARRAESRKRLDQDKWLAFGQAMLAPSRTGGLGENIGMAAGALREESARRAQTEADYDSDLDLLAAQEIAAEAQAIDQLLTQAGHANQAKGIHGAIQTMVNPADVGKPVAEQQLVFGSMKLQEDGQWRLEPLADSNGVLFEAADRLDPARAAALIKAAEQAESQVGRSEAQIAQGYMMREPLLNVRRVVDLFENAETIIETSGIQALKNRLANFLGVDFGDTVELTEIQIRAAEHFMSRLESLKGSSSDRDVMEMKGISVGLGTNATTNYRILKQMEQIYSGDVRKGIREAYQSKDMDAVSDLWLSADGNDFISGTPFIKNEEEYNELAPGTSFYMEGEWGGARYTKPAEEEEAEGEE